MPSMPKTSPRSSEVTHYGITVRLYERGGAIQRCVTVNGRKDRKSLRHRDWTLAERQAKELAEALAEMQLTGATSGPVTFGTVRRLYVEHRAPLLKPKRRAAVEKALEMFGAHLEPGGRPFVMDDFSQTHADAYTAARGTGTIRPKDHRARKHGVRAGTIRNELQALSTVCAWAVTWKVNGRRLLAHNPVKDVRQPVEVNPRRPVASHQRYEKLHAVAGRVDPSGQFRLALALAKHTGRRISAILHLRASDLLLNSDQVRRSLAALGQDERIADVWPQAIRWRAEHDKTGFESVTPIGATVRAELDRYLRHRPVLGDAWIFDSARKPGTPTLKAAADWWLGKAERAASLPHLERGGWHAFRRAWATARKHLPVQDVMAAGGWRDVAALQSAYQGADPATIRQVVEVEEASA
jgi:integrase